MTALDKLSHLPNSHPKLLNKAMRGPQQEVESLPIRLGELLRLQAFCKSEVYPRMIPDSLASIPLSGQVKEWQATQQAVSLAAEGLIMPLSPPTRHKGLNGFIF